MEKIRKNTARRLYNAGVEITIIPCKCRLGGAWFTGFRISKNDDPERDFDQIINAFEYYNCNPGTGKYTAFYVEGVRP